jgi:hypothetical protein
VLTNQPEKGRTPQSRDLTAERVEAVTESVVKPVVRRKLHVTLQDGDTRGRNQDALDIVGEVRVTLLSDEFRNRSSNGTIRDLAAYASTVAANACYQYLRMRFPERTRLRNKLRYLLSHSRELAIWKTSSGRWLCGAAGFSGSDKSVSLRSRTHDAETKSLNATDILLLLQSRLRDAGGPVYFDDIVEHIAEAGGITEAVELEEDVAAYQERYADPAPRIDTVLESKAELGRLWNKLQELSLEHRKALLLNIRDARGENLLLTVPLSRIATIRDIAGVLEMSIEELSEIWNSLPWDDLRIAEHLGKTRQQVINLRQTARAKLIRWRKEERNI